MKFYNYLKEESEKISIIDNNTCVNLLHTSYSQSFEKFNSDIRLYRGYKIIKFKNFVYDPTIYNRKPLYDTFTFEMLNNLPNWTKYPKRFQSISMINKNEFLKLSHYGLMYYCFPKNNAKLVICSDSDMHISFKFTRINTNYFGSTGYNNIMYLPDYLKNILKIISEVFNIPEFDTEIFETDTKLSYSEIVATGNKLLNRIKNNYNKISIKKIKNYVDSSLFQSCYVEQVSIFLGLIKQFYFNFEKLMEYYYNPILNKFTLTTINQLEDLYSLNEIWTNSQTIMILNKNIDSIINMYNKTFEKTKETI